MWTDDCANSLVSGCKMAAQETDSTLRRKWKTKNKPFTQGERNIADSATHQTFRSIEKLKRYNVKHHVLKLIFAVLLLYVITYFLMK